MQINELAPANGWIYTDNPRLAAPSVNQRGWLFRFASKFSTLLGRSQVPDVIALLHSNPRLFWPWLLFASRLMPFGKLPARLREKIILRTGWNCRSRYEWGQHVEIALRLGVSAAEIQRVALAPETETHLTDRLALQACDELCQHAVISTSTWTQLSEQFSTKELLEFMFLVGHYQMIAGLLNSAGLTLEPALERVLADLHQQLKTVN